MAVRTTRQSLAELRNAIRNDDKDVVIIPAEFLMNLLSTHAEAQDKFIATTEKFNETVRGFSEYAAKTSESLCQMANVLERMENGANDAFHHSLLEKMDKLSQAIASNGVSVVSHADKLKKNAERRREILGKTIRAKKLSQYYDELVSADTPYVPHMYRTKISRTTPEFEKPIHKEDAISKTRKEVRLMTERIKNWELELAKLEAETNRLLESVDLPEREQYQASLLTDDETVERERSSSIEKLKQTYDEEMKREGAEPDSFLLTYAEKSDTNRNSKKTQGYHPRGRRRRRRWPRD